VTERKRVAQGGRGVSLPVSWGKNKPKILIVNAERIGLGERETTRKEEAKPWLGGNLLETRNVRGFLGGGKAAAQIVRRRGGNDRCKVKGLKH